MKEFQKIFYNSRAWKDTRKAYTSYRGGLCERCLTRGLYRAGTVVHHKVHLTAENMSNPDISLAYDNLQLLCVDCHAAVHAKKIKRYRIDPTGKIIPTD